MCSWQSQWQVDELSRGFRNAITGLRGRWKSVDLGLSQPVLAAGGCLTFSSDEGLNIDDCGGDWGR